MLYAFSWSNVRSPQQAVLISLHRGLGCLIEAHRLSRSAYSAWVLIVVVFAKISNPSRWLASADEVRNQLEGHCKEYEGKIRPANDLEVKAVEEGDVSIYCWCCANLRTVAACALDVIGVRIYKTINRFSGAAVSLSAQRSGWIVRERKSDDRETLVLSVNSEEVHECKGWSDVWLNNKWLSFARLEDLTCVVRV